MALGQLQKGAKWPVEGPMVALVDGPEVPASAVHQPFTIGVGPQQVSWDRLDRSGLQGGAAR